MEVSVFSLSLASNFTSTSSQVGKTLIVVTSMSTMFSYSSRNTSVKSSNNF